MKNIFAIILSSLLFLNLSAQQINQVYKAKKINFLGLDYSAAVFIGYNGFKDPSALQILPDSWNSLFITEPEKYNIQKAFKVRFDFNLEIVKERNKTVNYTERITEKAIILPHLTKEDLQAIIDDYPVFEKTGVALVFIVDAYDKSSATGYYHFVFFQKETKEILLTYTVTGEAGGGGLRNYWAHSFYEAILKAGKRYSATAEFYRDYTE